MPAPLPPAVRPLGSHAPPRDTGRVAHRVRSLAARVSVSAGAAAYVVVVYVLVVLGGGALLRATPPSLPLAVLATAVVAVTLEPVRRVLHRALVVSAYDRLATFGAGMAGAVATEDVGPRMARLLAESTGARRVEVWLGDGDELLAAWPPDSRPVDRAAPTAEVHAVVQAGELLGSVVRDGGPLRPVERALLDALLGQAGLALRRVALTKRLRRGITASAARAEQLRASRQRIVATANAARSRLERDVHDGAQQHLVALAVRLRLARTLAGRDPERAAAQLPDLRDAARTALATLDELSQGIYPRTLTDAGVGAALRAATALSPVPVELVDGTGRRHPPEVEAAVYFSCLEAVQNAVKHADARRIAVRLTDDSGELGFVVHDDGRGLPATVTSGTGISGMRDRLEAAGGWSTVRGAPGGGTTVAGAVPAEDRA